ncbi:MAG: trans-sulfuration enzyme family protein [Egibacteraceae bacterium]
MEPPVERWDAATVAVAAGRGRGAPGDPLSVPPVLSSVYHAGVPREYGRETNPTWEALEEVLGALEGGQALSFGSGMGAISAVLDTLPEGSAVVCAADAYLGTRDHLADLHARGRLKVRLVDSTDTDATIAACQGVGLLWLESPTNPLMAIPDLAELSRRASAMGVPVVVDNTFATPLLQRPLDLGAAVVVHSLSKFLAGHSDVVLGAVVSRDDELMARVRRRRLRFGAIAGPLEAWLALRGIRTLPVRMERAQANAAELARRLAAHPAVARVRYPGLPDDPGHGRAAVQMRGFGAMLSFECAGGRAAADAVCASVRVAVYATSLGGVETTLERRNRHPGEEAVPPSLIRLSVGCEHVEDLWDDLDQALQNAGTVT